MWKLRTVLLATGAMLAISTYTDGAANVDRLQAKADVTFTGWESTRSDQVPEPASMLLVGAALVLVSRNIKR
jgi:hypothetical protein